MSPQKLWVVGEEVLADDFNDYVQNQVAAAFPNAAARTAQWAAPPTGALSTLDDSAGVLWIYYGAGWHAYGAGGVLAYVTGTADTALPTAPTITDLPGMTGTVTIPAGRRIRVEALCQFGVGGSGAGSAFLRIADSGGTDIFADVGTTVPINATAVVVNWGIITPAAGTFTWKARVYAPAANAIFAQEYRFQIADVGPA